MESSLLKAAIQQEIQQMMDRGLDNAIAKNPFIAAINAYRFARESILLNFVDQISPFCFLGLVFNWDGF
ncbi:hypothetical protein H6G52_10350 [Limnothrix sp. FACHB-881]|uniref:hypothetical protein n=1 Tax=Limnothrix sp. FACHB-881 TaxID=2692819 RepID=UPI001682117F|nr:hypothetical protein [Limnothrix sp. FACHB-881]MBD2635759.1 hypothetical protein [Limnothrix sp. FACHB-881]